MTADSEIFLDTNILVHSTLKDFDPEKHFQCQQVLEDLNKRDFSIYVSTQILREFYAVVTTERYLKTPLSPNQAKNQVLYFKSVFNIIEFTQEVIPILLDLVEEFQIKGQKIHDASIAATMLHHNITQILTYNRKDFDQFRKIGVFAPGELLDLPEVENKH